MFHFSFEKSIRMKEIVARIRESILNSEKDFQVKQAIIKEKEKFQTILEDGSFMQATQNKANRTICHNISIHSLIHEDIF